MESKSKNFFFTALPQAGDAWKGLREIPISLTSRKPATHVREFLKSLFH